MNMFLQPYVGSRSDRTHTRFGRRKPWLMLGAPLAAFFFILVPFVRENFVLIALAILGDQPWHGALPLTDRRVSG